MALDRWVAIFFLLISLIYGYTAFDYQLLPFERNMPFLPNTMPKGVAVLGALLSLIVIFSARSPDADGPITMRTFLSYKLGQAVILLVAMAAFALHKRLERLEKLAGI